jgi:hypothetical protein
LNDGFIFLWTSCGAIVGHEFRKTGADVGIAEPKALGNLGRILSASSGTTSARATALNASRLRSAAAPATAFSSAAEEPGANRSAG